ncbi:signal recognition particle-docking protein FtsY [Erwinia sp.]|uniref:signal recognition particle-docking protein FtsY n=1 Tax=Erwinia citreus TaxID=558 RepID=UPI00289D3654|nr:signal recognition particle-docking protein FtsY [Erwinia sp.]
MAKNKKRGFFSWLGLGREEKAPEEEVQTPEQPQSETAHADTPPEVEQRAEAVVEVTETVARQQAEQDPQEQVSPAPEESAAVKPETQPEEIAVAKPEPEEEWLPEETAGLEPEEEWLPEETAAVQQEPELLPEEIVAPDPEPEEVTIAAEQADEITPEELEAVALSAGASAAEMKVIEEEESVAAALVKVEQANAAEEQVSEEQTRPTKEGFFARLKRSLVKTRQNLGSGFVSLFRGKKIDDELFEELEEQLLIADVGVDTTRRIISNLTAQASRKQLRDAEALYGLLKQEMADILAKVEAPLDVTGKTPFVILMVGVNGVGKTTTIGKLARQYQAEGKSVMLAAGDTFRAAAVEQLQVWGQRNNIPVVAQHTGADSASVIFDAIQAAKARNVDVLIADTAGRLQNKSHLMEELKKITRVMKKLDEQAPHEVMLTIDASTGQNAISQTKLFHEAVGLTGITLTKLDGTAKGGVIFSVADQFGIPIRYIGVGEGIEDLRSFKANDFIEALFARED